MSGFPAGGNNNAAMRGLERCCEILNAAGKRGGFITKQNVQTFWTGRVLTEQTDEDDALPGQS